MARYDALNGVTADRFAAERAVRLAAVRRRLRPVHAGEPVAAAVVRAVRRPRPLLRGDVPVLHLAGHVRSGHATTWLVVVLAMFYTLCLALFTTIHPMF